MSLTGTRSRSTVPVGIPVQVNLMKDLDLVFSQSTLAIALERFLFGVCVSREGNDLSYKSDSKIQ